MARGTTSPAKGSAVICAVLRFFAFSSTPHRLLDFLVTLFSGALAFWLRLGGVFPETMVQPAVQAYLLSAWTVCLLLWFGLGFFRAACAFASWQDVGKILLLTCATVGLAMLSGYLADRLVGIPRSLPLFHFGLLLVGFCSVRVFALLCASLVEERYSEDAFARQDCILVGETRLASAYIEVLRCERRSVSSIAGLLTSDQVDQEVRINSVPILGRPDEIGTVLQELKVHAIAVRQCVLLSPRDEIANNVLNLLDREGIEIVDFYAQLLGSTKSVAS
jgi:hypothetical protein